MRATGGIEIIQIGDVLEVVGVLVAVLHSGVGDHIVAVLVDYQINSLLLQNGNALLENLSVGSGRSGHSQRNSLRGVCVAAGIIIGGVRAAIAAAGCKRKGQGQSQQQGQ